MTEPGAPHRRRNLLTGDWVLVSPQRLMRPWRGETAAPRQAAPAAHDPSCHLCPRTVRASGSVNPDYAGPFVFDNDFPALLPSSPPLPDDDLLVAEAESGACKVICYGPDHHRGLADLSVDETEHIMRLQKAESATLMADPAIRAVFVFENRGDMMGASSPHPHAQIWATSSVPGELAREVRQQTAYRTANGRPLLLDYARREISERVRIVAEDDHFIAVVPFWAAWPFETLILPLRPAATLEDLNDADLRSLSRLLSTVTRAYERLFDCPFPYTFGWHQAPKGVSADDGFTLHAHFFPPLLRSATVRKHMVGFEMLAGAQRDLTAEAAAERLRSALD